MKKLILILTLVLACLCVIAFYPELQLRLSGQPSVPGSTAGTVPPTTQTEPTTQIPTTTPPTTVPIPEGWQETDGYRYYYVNGTVLTGWQEVDGLNRYFHTDGKLASGFAEIEGNRYYFDAEGCCLTGWQEVDGKSYYFGENGVVYTGWLTLEERTYYMKADGAMARGCVEIDGVNHYFTSAGAPVLVLNPWSSLPEGYAPDLVYMGSYYGENKRVDSSCVGDLEAMMKACNKQSGHRVFVVSSYRTVASQEKLFKNQVDSNLKKGYSQEEAERLAAQVVAVPGTSEHHSGLAVDIIDSCCSWDLEEIQASLPGQQWLMEHSWEYGFILRYPEGTTEETGIIYEPWHYRYVGKELAKELHDLGMTLEAYTSVFKTISALTFMRSFQKLRS